MTVLLFFISFTTFGQHTVPAEISANSIKKTLSYLSSDSLKGRGLGSKGIEQAAQYIENKFEKFSLKPYYKTYRDSFQHQGKTGYNLIAIKEGSAPNLKDELVVIGAHYDHLGIISPMDGDSIANGANDDASGTTAVLTLARYFADKKTKRSMLFVLFSGEEEGLIGSTHLAKRLKEQNASLYWMLNIEMIGVPLNNADHLAYLTGYNKSNFANKFNTHAGEKILGLFKRGQSFNLFKRSDNYSFFRYLAVPAHTLSTFTFDNFDQYHKVGDEVELLDIPFMKTLIQQSIPGIEGVVNAKEKAIQLKN